MLSKSINIIFFIISVILFSFTGCNKSSSSVVINGIIDLSNYEFDKNKTVKLDGSWEFYWNKLLSPKDFKEDKINLNEKIYFNVPKVWNGNKIKDKELSGSGFATYRLIVKINNPVKKYGLKLMDMATAYKLWINGKEASSNGIVGIDKNSMKSQFLPKTIYFYPESKNVELVLQISNFNDNKGGTWKSILFGDAKEIEYTKFKDIFIDIFLLGILAIMGFYHISLYFLRRDEKTPLYFGILCLVMGLRTVILGERLLIYMFPDFNWDMALRLEHSTMYLSIIFWSMFIYPFFKNFISRGFLQIIQGVSVIFILITFTSSAIMYTKLICIYQIVILMFFLYITYVIIHASIKKEKGAFIFLLGFIVVFIFIVNDILFDMGFINTGYFISLGFLFFIVIQAFFLAAKSSDAFKRVEFLSYKIKEEKDTLEKRVKERTFEIAEKNKQLSELDKVKTNFFANISHELRTPLTLILSPVQSALQGDYKQSIDDSFFKNLERNAIKLLTLVNNLLDFSKIEAGKMALNISLIDIGSFIKKFKESFEFASKSKGVILSFSDDLPESVSLYLDVEKIEKIIMNLFSNALKFTKDGGSIDITLKDKEDEISIIFNDTGVGIPLNKIESIFDRFSQADTSVTRSYEGTGIGLALVKEFIALHGGIVTVASNYIEDNPDDHGSTFVITIPKGREYLDNKEGVIFIENENIPSSIKDVYAAGLNLVEDEDGKEDILNSILTKEKGIFLSNRVLIVEDNKDMRDFLSFLFSDFYQIETAINGEDGLEKAKTFLPDAIITDVMMPVKDGYEMTRDIKSDSSLMHIPVLMLTAKAELSYKLEGLELGADDYLTKPFNSKELLTRVKSLLKSSEYKKQLIQRNNEIEAELEIARLIQDKLLPSKLPNISGYKSHAAFIPFDKVGGDFYDYKIKDNSICLFVADSSGHGLASSYLSLIAKIAFDGVNNYNTASRVLYIVNDYICRSTVKDNFVTSFCGVIDIKSNMLKYSSAGHEPQILYRPKSDEIISLKTKGTPLGWFAEMKLDEKEIQLESGDRLILFTDGIIEAQGNSRELYGDERFYEFIRKNKEKSPEEFSDNLLQTLKKYTGYDKFEDDVTLVVFDVM